MSPDVKAYVLQLLTGKLQIRLTDELRSTMQHFATAVCTDIETVLDAWVATAMPQLEEMTPPTNESENA